MRVDAQAGRAAASADARTARDCPCGSGAGDRLGFTADPALAGGCPERQIAGAPNDNVRPEDPGRTKDELGGGSELAGAEGIAAAGVAGLEAAVEPANALIGGAVAEGIGAHAAGRVALEGVVTDRGGGGQGLLDVALLEDLALARGVGPHTGVAVGLEFEAHRGAVGSLRATRALDLVRGA